MNAIWCISGNVHMKLRSSGSVVSFSWRMGYWFSIKPEGSLKFTQLVVKLPTNTFGLIMFSVISNGLIKALTLGQGGWWPRMHIILGLQDIFFFSSLQLTDTPISCYLVTSVKDYLSFVHCYIDMGLLRSYPEALT